MRQHCCPSHQYHRQPHRHRPSLFVYICLNTLYSLKQNRASSENREQKQIISGVVKILQSDHHAPHDLLSASRETIPHIKTLNFLHLMDKVEWLNSINIIYK